jgi:predicted  nucleic acid-binding Zn-ribbon protein
MSETNLNKLNRLQNEVDELRDSVLAAMKSVRKLEGQVKVLEKEAAARKNGHERVTKPAHGTSLDFAKVRRS